MDKHDHVSFADVVRLTRLVDAVVRDQARTWTLADDNVRAAIEQQLVTAKPTDSRRVVVLVVTALGRTFRDEALNLLSTNGVQL